MLEIKNLKVSAENKHILDGIDLKVQDGETHVIMGKNGIGKSTLCKVLLNDPSYTKEEGTILYNGEDISVLSPDEIARKGIFLLEQNPTEIPGVTNAEMLRMASRKRGIEETVFEFNKRVNSALERLNIDKSFIHRDINSRMSGGEKKKNEILQIFMFRPKLIILDELDSGLDVDGLKNLSTYINKYKKETNAMIIIITHHTNILDYIVPDKVHVLDNGKFIKEGNADLAYEIEKNGFTGTFNISGE